MALERELKYSSPDGQVPALADLAAALARLGLTVRDRGSATQTDVYYDDEAASVRSVGMALRVRSVGGVRKATLKSRGSVMHGVHERDEFEEPLPHGHHLLWPAGLTALLGKKLPRVNMAAFTARMIIRTERRRFDIARDGVTVAELSFDEVVCQPSAEVALSYSIDQAMFHEVELEALATPAGSTLSVPQLEEIGQAAQQLMPLYPSDITKLERAATLLAAFEE